MIFPVNFLLKCGNANCHKIVISDQILSKLKRGVDEPSLCIIKKHQSIGKHFCERLFNDTVCMEFRICISIAKYENDIFSLFETSSEFIHAFLPFKK